MAKDIETIPLRLPGETVEILREIAKGAGTTPSVVASVLISLAGIRERRVKHTPSEP